MGLALGQMLPKSGPFVKAGKQGNGLISGQTLNSAAITIRATSRVIGS
jgi:hypothetical protein